MISHWKVISLFKEEVRNIWQIFRFPELTGIVITNNTMKLMAIDSYNHIDTLKKYMQDMPDIYKSIEEIDVPKQNNLIKLVKQYDGLDQKQKHGQKQNLIINHVKKINSLIVYLSPEGAYSDFKLMPLTPIISLPEFK